MLSALDVAEYLLSLVNEDDGDLMSHLRLQKLLYYAQGFHLAIFDQPVFSEPIEAWTHGPVVPAVYHEYKKYGSGQIPPPDGIDFSNYSDETRELLDEVYDVYGQFSASRLRNLTHQEPPWQNAVPGRAISTEAMKGYFKTLLVDD